MSSDSRYARQQQVKHVCQGGQDALAGCRVLVVGAGGLGCHVATQLAGAGVGRLIIVDHDVVSLTNLHRQHLYREADIGAGKAQVAARELSALNSEIQIEAITERVSPANVHRLTTDCTVVVDAADNFATSYLLSDACSTLQIPMVSASVNATFGHLGVFCFCGDKRVPTYRAVFPRLPRQGGNCDSVGVTGPSVGIIGSLQAQESLKLIVGGEPNLAGKLLYLDLWDYSQHLVDVSNASEAVKGTVDLLDLSDLCEADFIVDVRQPAEIIEQPQNFTAQCQIPLADIPERIDGLPKIGRIVCVCRTGQRALLAAQMITDQGFTEVAALLPGEV